MFQDSFEATAPVDLSLASLSPKSEILKGMVSTIFPSSPVSSILSGDTMLPNIE